MESPQADQASDDDWDQEPNAADTDAVIETFKRDIDFTLVERNLRMTMEERSWQLAKMTKFIARFRPLVSGQTSSHRD